MRRIGSIGAAGLLLLAMAGPASAAAPEVFAESFVTDPYVWLECDGFDIMEQTTVSFRIYSYFDRQGNWLRDVGHYTDTAVEWRSDTGEQVATLSDAGGTFTATADSTFTWTGVHSEYTTRSGVVYRFVGRVVVAEVEPGEFERIFEGGQFAEIDPCSW